MLVDFLVEFTLELGVPIRIYQVMVRKWCVYVDSTSNTRGFGIEVVMISPEEVRLEKSLRLDFRTSNNEVKYETLISSLRAVQQLGVEEVEVFSDSKLVVSQIERNFEAMDSHMQQYLKLYGAL